MASSYEKYKLPQRWFSDDYLSMLKGLLPKGIIWDDRFWSIGTIIQDVISHPIVWQDTTSSSDIKQDSLDGGGGLGDMLMRLLSCFANELSRIESDAWTIVNITDPGVAEEGSLTSWERVLGLPGDCYSGESLTTEERQVNAHTKLFSIGQITTLAWYEEVAAALGFTTFTIEEYPIESTPRIFGIAQFGVQKFGGRGGYSILNITELAGDGNEKVLKCIFYKFKQAHVVITKNGGEWNP